MNQEKEVLNLEKRLIELSRIAYQRDIVTYSDFLTLMNRIFYIRCQKKRFLPKLYLLAAMKQQSVRWRHLSLMLFICVTGKRILRRKRLDILSVLCGLNR